MGFGHRVYKAEDPRAAHLRQMSAELAAASGDDTYFRMSRRMEEVVFAAKGLYPNVDFYAATVYHYLGIPTDLFTAGLLGQPDGRLDRACHRAARRQPPDQAGQRVHRRERLTWVPLDAR